MVIGDESTGSVPPDVAHEEPKDAKKPSREHRSKLAEAVSTLVTAVTEGGGRSIS